MDDNKPAAVGQCSLNAVRESAGNVSAQDEAVHHKLDGVLFILFQRDLFAQVIVDAVDTHTGKAAAARVLQELGMLALFAAHDGRQHLKARPLGHGKHLIDDLVHALTTDLSAAFRAVGRSRARPEQTQIVIDLRDCADGRTRVFGGGLLVDGDRGRKSLDHIDIWLVHLPQKLPHISGKRLHIASASLGIDRIERERRLSGAGKSGKHAQCVAWDLHVHIF